MATIIILAGHSALSNHPVIPSLSRQLIPFFISLPHTNTLHAFTVNAPSIFLLHCFLSPLLPLLKNTAGLTFLHAQTGAYFCPPTTSWLGYQFTSSLVNLTFD